MAAVDERVVGGRAEATRGQALSYLLAGSGRKVSDGEVHEIVDALWEIGERLGIRPDLKAAQLAHETGRLSFGGQVAPGQCNPSGIGATNDGAAGLTFPDWRTGILASYVHLVAWLGGPAVVPAIEGDYTTQLDPRIPLVDAVRRAKGAVTTWRSLGSRWAVPGLGYGDGLQRHLDAMLALPREEEDIMPRIALSAGHWNRDGGNAEEKKRTIRLMRACAEACRAGGMEVRCVQAETGDPGFAGGLWDVAHTVVRWAREGWVPDIWLECHTEGVGNPHVRGVFSIYPDMEGDTDTDVRDRLGTDLARRVAAATGLPIRGDGLMSERQTGVGLDGYRLGIFGQSAAIRESTTRLIVEFGAHTAPADVAIMEQSDFFDLAGRAVAEGFAAFLGLSVGPTPIDVEVAPAFVEVPGGPAENPDAWHASETDKWVIGPFLAYWRDRGGLPIFGFPQTGEYYDEKLGRNVQWFERARFERLPDANDVQLGRVGAELLATRG